MTTNKDGYAISEKLPIGKYIVKEAKTDDEYVLDENEYHIVVSTYRYTFFYFLCQYLGLSHCGNSISGQKP